MTTRRMIANLQPRDRIQFASRLLNPRSRGITQAEVQEVKKHPEGWHQVQTDKGLLKPLQPTEKVEIL